MGIQSKLLLPGFMALCLFGLVLHFYWAPQLTEYARKDFIKMTEQELAIIENDLSRDILARDISALYSTLDYLSKIHQDSWSELKLYNDKGKIIYPLFPQPVAKISPEFQIPFHYPLKQLGTMLGHIELNLNWQQSYIESKQRINQLEYFLFITIFFILIFSILWQNFLVRTPILDLQKAASSLSQGDFQAKLPTIAKDEIGKLTQTFANMRNNLLHTQQQLKKVHAELETKVDERTQELQNLNQTLQYEIDEKNIINEKLHLYEMVFEHAAEGIVITDKNNDIIDINPSFTKITGYSRQDALGKKPSLTKSERHSQQFFKDLWESINRVGHWTGEIWDAKKDGTTFPKRLSINSIRNEKGESNYYVGVFTDITQNKRTEQQLKELAYYDPLTKLPNRTLFVTLLQKELASAQRHSGMLALLYIDLDKFKYVNDSLGHSQGDDLLVEIARRFQESSRNSDFLARIGGDEFTLLLTDLKRPEAAASVAQKLIDNATQPVSLKGQKVYIGASIGISIFPNDGDNVDILMKNADMAMYHAKEMGRNNHQYFTQAMNIHVANRLNLERELQHAIEHGEFCLYYQPKVNIQSGQIVGAEALIRWAHPDKGIISPLDFIPIAEETGQIIAVGEWVLRQACQQLQAWKSQLTHSFRIAVNISIGQLRQTDFIHSVNQILNEENMTSDLLEFEITESMMMSDMQKNVAVLNEIKAMGIAISIDDFGTGYSSLSYLKQLPINQLKIDRSFIKDIGFEKDDESITSTIISMSHHLQLTVIAEGVETQQQLDFLKQEGCDEMQGYFFSRPLPADDFSKLLDNTTNKLVT